MHEYLYLEMIVCVPHSVPIPYYLPYLYLIEYLTSDLSNLPSALIHHLVRE